ncbi:MAG: tectonin domain-containing protein [Terrimicrobiaceae bacterium]
MPVRSLKTFDRPEMNQTMQILTSTYSISRGCLIAALLLVNLIPRLVQANEGPGNIWGVNAKNQIFTWAGDGWRQIAGELEYVSASADGAVWGVNSKDEVFRWTDNSFTPVPNGRLKQISVGNPKNIWGVNAKNQIFTWTGNGWRQIAGELKYVSASADGAVWGVNSKDEVFRWTGNSFTPVPNGSLKQISVGNSSGGHPVRSRAN